MERFKTAKRYINRFGEHKPIMADIVIKYYGTKLLVVSLPDSQSYVCMVRPQHGWKNQIMEAKPFENVCVNY